MINKYCFIYKLCSWWVNLRFPFEIEYNNSCRKFALTIVLNIELSVWIAWEESYFIVHSYEKVNFIFLNLMKFRLMHFALFFGCVLDYGFNSCHFFHVMYLEINAKFCRNFKTCNSCDKNTCATNEQYQKLAFDPRKHVELSFMSNTLVFAPHKQFPVKWCIWRKC